MQTLDTWNLHLIMLCVFVTFLRPNKYVTNFWRNEKSDVLVLCDNFNASGFLKHSSKTWSYPYIGPGGPWGCQNTSRLLNFLANQLTDDGKSLRFTRRPRFIPRPGRFLLLIYATSWVDHRTIVRLEGLGKLKNPMISGFKPATFRLVAQWLDQLRYRLPFPIWNVRASKSMVFRWHFKNAVFQITLL
jgi:hypothetical protein